MHINTESINSGRDVMTFFWGFMFVLSVILHVSWGLLFYFAMRRIGVNKFLHMLLFMTILWVMVVYLCSGCPLTHLNLYLWDKTFHTDFASKYGYRDSVLYRYIVEPIGSFIESSRAGPDEKSSGVFY